MMFIATVVNMAIVSSLHWSIENSNAICVRHLLQDISVFSVIFLLKSSSVWTRFQIFPVLGVLGFSKLSVDRASVFSCWWIYVPDFCVWGFYLYGVYSVYRVWIFLWLTLNCLKCLKKLAQVINNMGFQCIVLTEHHATIVGFPTARRIVWLNNTLLFYVFLTASFEIMQERFEVYCPKLFTLPEIWGAPFLGPDHKFRIGLVRTDCIKR
jgi:hypothetical protein